MTVPITIITGFLGAGKTTLVNHIVRHNNALPDTADSDRARLAIVENEFALEFGIENELLLPSGNEDKDAGNTDAAVREVFEFGQGCICCSAAGEFYKVLQELATQIQDQDVHYDHIIVETTGLAGSLGGSINFPPAPLDEVFHLASIVAVVDVSNFTRHLRDPERPVGVKNEAEEQVVSADVVLINKVDSPDLKDRVTEISTEIRALNPTATFHETSHAAVTLRQLIALSQNGPIESVARTGVPMAQTTSSNLLHDASVKPEIVVVDGKCAERPLRDWLEGICKTNERNLFRLKGVFNVQRDDGTMAKMVAQGVHDQVVLQASIRTWEPERGDAPTNKLVLIGRDLGPVATTAKQSFEDTVLISP